MTVHSCPALPLHTIPTPTVFPVGPANIHLFLGPPVTLFDAGTNTQDAFEALVAGLQQTGVSLADVEQVILTHHHLDHVGLLRRIKNASDAKVLAHVSVPEQLPFMFDIRGMRDHMDRLLFELGAPASEVEAAIAQRLQLAWLYEETSVDDTFESGAQIGPFTAHFRPGHSSTDTIFTHDSQGWAVTGDHLIHRVTPSPLLRRHASTGVREKSLVQYHESLQKTRALPISWCFAGHGVAFQNHTQAIDDTLQHIERRGERILHALPPAGATPYEMTLRLFPHVNTSSLYYCLSTTTGHLELLETQGKVHCSREDGVLRFCPAAPLA